MEERADEWRKKGGMMIIAGIVFLIISFLVFTTYEIQKGEFAKSLLFALAGIFLVFIGKKSYHFG